MAGNRLNVIGLISGGKDSFFSLLHCIEHGHRVVALANLYPAGHDGALPIETQWIDPEAPLQQSRDSGTACGDKETDLNSFMYQTVGHEVIPLYAAATGLPLYRRQIHGGAVRHERDYDHAAISSEKTNEAEETESMAPLLRTIMERHPEANAVCAGAILSTYQRTRVESIALRLGLTPLAYLWKYPVLPTPTHPPDETQLLRDMAAIGLDARIIKVASAGLDEDHLWLKASSSEAAETVKRALRKFGAAQGAALGEGGEFETLVIDGPGTMFRRRIHVPEDARGVVKEGGGTAWVKIREARIEEKDTNEGNSDARVRCPNLLDPGFARTFESLTNSTSWNETPPTDSSQDTPKPSLPSSSQDVEYLTSRSFRPDMSVAGSSIQHQTSNIVAQALSFFQTMGIDPSQVSNTLILLRNMSDFPAVNAEYSKLFIRANPPSRVTISCGDLLTEGSNIIISFSIPRSAAGRQGLHVQSRSYWAPANIGPYSQGIVVPLLAESKPGLLFYVSIAGQIPLIPSSMALPESSSTSSQLQITLSLQHLWRIATDMRVQWWSSAVAFFSVAGSDATMKQRAKMAAYAWKQANRPPPEEEDDEAQLDPWDLKHNSQYMTLGNAEDQAAASPPEWSLLPLRQQNDWESRLPPVFAVEVEALPRQAEVEWHAHMGIGGVSDGALETFFLSNLSNGSCKAWHMLVRESEIIFLHTTVSYRGTDQESGEAALGCLNAAYGESLEALEIAAPALDSQPPYLLYLDSGSLDTSKLVPDDAAAGTAFIPCHSIWASDGTKWSALALYRRVLSGN